MTDFKIQMTTTVKTIRGEYRVESSSDPVYSEEESDYVERTLDNHAAAIQALRAQFE